MNHAQLTLLIAGLLLLTPLWLALWRSVRRERRRRGYQPFPAAWRMQLARDCALYRRVPLPLRTQTELLTQEFLDHHRLVGCSGLQLTPAMGRLIAFQACLLVVRRGLAEYDSLGAVLIHPAQFVVENDAADADGVVTPGASELSGQSMDTARIVLSWADVAADSRECDGCNVVVHEFAHFLDSSHDGALSAPDSPARRALLTTELAALRAQLGAGEPTVIDPYGSEDPAEFFAVASEAFLDQPRQLRDRHPQLYATLAGTYGIDPALWPEPSS